MKKYNNFQINSKGLTLIEMIAAVGIFAITIGTISGLFISAVRAQRKSLATQELLDRTSYVIEYMGRTIRMAQKELNCIDPTDPTTCDPSNPPQCLTTYGYGYNYETNLAGDRIRFINYDTKCQEFFLEGNQIKERKSTDHTAANFGSSLPLTPTDLNISSLKFNLSGQSQNDDFQPRVTIFLEIESGRIPQSPPKIQVQTSISQRALDVKY